MDRGLIQIINTTEIKWKKSSSDISLHAHCTIQVLTEVSKNYLNDQIQLGINKTI